MHITRAWICNRSTDGFEHTNILPDIAVHSIICVDYMHNSPCSVYCYLMKTGSLLSLQKWSASNPALHRSLYCYIFYHPFLIRRSWLLNRSNMSKSWKKVLIQWLSCTYSQKLCLWMMWNNISIHYSRKERLGMRPRLVK